MSFNLFGPATKCDIRVGYIDPERGFVDGLSVYEANKYAKLNPGTQFVFKKRDEVRFLNINEVNKLTPKDLIPKTSAYGDKGCSGITGLDIYEDGDGGSTKIKPEVLNEDRPQVLFHGGGGIGAIANPIFGDDGGLLAVDLIDGGWGYSFAPVTEVLDRYGIGTGAVVRSIMIGDPDYPDCKFFRTVQTFENEEDFEDYDLSSCSGEEETPLGRRYNAEGQDIGIWDPSVYANFNDNPARIEAQRYQNFLLSLQGGQRISIEDNVVRNWWTTRRFKPVRITSQNKTSRIIHDVEFPAWTEFMNRFAVSPVPPSNVPGSDFAGIEYQLEWEENFPYDGDYQFKYLADNVADIYLDNEFVARTQRFKGSPDKVKKFVKAGVHRIRVDLENVPIYTPVEQQKDESRFIDTEFEVYGQGTEKHRQIKFSFTSEGGGHSFVLENVSKSGGSYKKDIKILRNTNYKVLAIADASPPKSEAKDREYKIEYEGLNRANNPVFVSPGGKSIRLKDGDGDDYNATFQIDSASPGIKAKFSENGSKLIVKGQSKGDITLKLSWNDNPRTAGVAVKSISIGDTKWIQRGEKGNVSRTININKISNTKSASGVVEQGTLQKFGVRTKEKGNNSSKIIFADYVGSLNDNDDMQVRVNRGTFTASNKKQITAVGPQGRQTRGTFDLNFRVDVKSEPKGSSKSNSGSETVEVFNTKKYIDKADRKLWRINPEAGRDGDFLSRYGVLPFNPRSDKASTDDFAGTHVIRWEYVDFPVDGNYNIEVMVDDDVDIYIGNRSGDGRVAIGNGLRDIDAGGDEVIIRKKGFSGPGKSTGKSLETKFFRAGKYRIRAELKQIKGKPIAKGNPMALALRIKTSVEEKKVVSAKSWNQNPMGVALAIDAPLPPIPQEPKPVGEGRCPNNPLWTTRFPGSADKWFPVTYPAWSKFTNRYAMSPIPPLGTPDSDAGGQIFRTSWVIEAPYAGFYGMKGTVDNGGRILVDGKEILSGGMSFGGKTLKGFRQENPETVKFPLSQGKHTIEVEVTNQKTDTFKTIEKKVFSTSDWLQPVKTKEKSGDHDIVYVKLNSSNKNLKVSSNGKKITLKDGGGNDTNATFEIVSGDAVFSNNGRKISGTGDATIKLSWDDNPKTQGVAVKSIEINGVRWTQSGEKGSEKKKVSIGLTKSSGLKSGSVVDGVSYVGPTQITSYKRGFISPVFQDVNLEPNEEIQGKTWVMRWENVDFPIDGTYKIKARVDDSVVILVDGERVGKVDLAQGIRGIDADPYRYLKFNATKGKRTVELRLSNIRIAGTGFRQNPTYVRVDITAPSQVATGKGQSWKVNPIGISAILIPPPCPLEVIGKGKICQVVVDDPGNGYPKPQDGGTGESTYPVTLELDGVEVINPGINYNCGVDQLVIEPSNGAQLTYECDTFGRIIKVNVEPTTPGVPAGRGFTRQPNIRMISDTGINFQAVPRFRVVRDPVDAEILPEQIIQVTDLVGLKLTGYVNGRAYYGSVFYKGNVRYAGVYETPGQLIQVYDTLQESIDAEVTTPPSAILRQGTDVRSNNPRLNIPGTPDTLT